MFFKLLDQFCIYHRKYLLYKLLLKLAIRQSRKNIRIKTDLSFYDMERRKCDRAREDFMIFQLNVVYYEF